MQVLRIGHTVGHNLYVEKEAMDCECWYSGHQEEAPRQKMAYSRLKRDYGLRIRKRFLNAGLNQK